MLWPDGRASTNGKNLTDFINAGYRAAKAVDAGIKVVVHLDSGNDNGLYRWFFDILEKHGAHYDVIGMSYYPYWLKEKKDYTETIDDLGKNLVDMADRYHKEVMVVEIGGEATRAANTRDMLAAVIKKVRAVPGNKGLGVVYWEPEGAASWSHYNLSCWGADGRPTEALDGFLEQTAPSK
jgi:arabinogalactan endo-1,4-beta-galactosidase